MNSSISMVVRMGNLFKISRIINGIADVNKAVEDVWKKIEQYRVIGGCVSWKVSLKGETLSGQQAVDNNTHPYNVCSFINIDVIALLVKNGIVTGLEVEVLNENIKCSYNQAAKKFEPQEELSINQFPWQELESQASEIWTDADELIQLCDLLHHYLLRMTEWNNHDAKTQVMFEPIFNTKDMLQRRSMKIRESAKAINSWPDTDLLAA